MLHSVEHLLEEQAFFEALPLSSSDFWTATSSLSRVTDKLQDLTEFNFKKQDDSMRQDDHDPEHRCVLPFFGFNKKHAEISKITISSTNEKAVPTCNLNQSSKWQERANELLEFRKEYGHCSSPSHWPRNTSPFQWIKRQRYQFKLKKDGKHSNLTDIREKTLNDLGFVWDSHGALWHERLNELSISRHKHGHSNVPTKYPENHQLAIWAKCQRRQFKLYIQGDKRSNITMERISKLSDAEFVFNPRANKKEQKKNGGTS